MLEGDDERRRLIARMWRSGRSRHSMAQSVPLAGRSDHFGSRQQTVVGQRDVGVERAETRGVHTADAGTVETMNGRPFGAFRPRMAPRLRTGRVVVVSSMAPAPVHLVEVDVGDVEEGEVEGHAENGCDNWTAPVDWLVVEGSEAKALSGIRTGDRRPAGRRGDRFPSFGRYHELIYEV